MQLTINGKIVDAPDGASVLDAADQGGIDIPSVCHDARCTPAGSCRMCLVEIKGKPGLQPACQTPARDGMAVATDTRDLEEYRRTELGWYAAKVSPADFDAFPDKELHRLMRRYGVAPAGAAGSAERIDASVPQIRVDMNQCIDCLRCVQICRDLQGENVWHEIKRGDESRIVPRLADLLADGGCVACGACTDACPTAALTDTGAAAPDEWLRTTCTYCGVGCELEVGVAAGRIVATRPAKNAPVNKGHACAKGRYGLDFIASPDRIIQPLLRQDGGWQQSSWDVALQACADGLTDIIDTHGPDAVGILASSRSTNEDSYLAQKFARLVVGTNNVDCCARVCHTPTAAAMKALLGAGAATNSFDDIERAETILVAGANPLECHPVIGARIRQQVLKGQSNLIVIDPRRTGLAEIATVHLGLKPGTDIPLQNAIANVIISEGLHDAAFVNARVDEFDAYAAHVAEWTPERAATVCEVPAEKIIEAARLYATAKPAYCAHGLGITEHVQGTEGVMGLCNLALITGNMGRPGAGINPLRGQNNVQGTAHMGCDPGIMAGAQPVQEARPAFEEAWNSALPKGRGLHLMEMIDAAADGTLKALVVIGYDIAATLANESAVRDALEKIDLVVVVDLFMTETARDFGHVFLPAASALEKDGTFMNGERRVARVRKLVEPPGTARADWDILCDLAGRMGARDQFSYADPEAVWDEIRAVWPAAAGIRYARLDAGGLQWPCPEEDHPGTGTLHSQAFGHGVRTRLRRLSFHETKERTDAAYPLMLTTGRNLYQFNVGTMTRRSRNLAQRPTDTLDLSPEDAAELAISEGDLVVLESRYGSAEVPARIDTRLPKGRVFATFHDPSRHINRVTSHHRDRMVGAPEYKRTAVRVRKAS